MDELWIESECPEPCAQSRAAAEVRQDTLTKPRGSLGVLEALAIQLAALQATDRPRAAKAPIIVFAGDHGITGRGVSLYPSDVTVQMLHNFAAGGAAITVLARELGVPVSIVDAGTLADYDIAGITTDKPRRGTRDFSVEPAMTAADRAYALGAGRRAVHRAIQDGADLVILGEMGIGNTTAAAAIAAALLGTPPGDLVGAGTGLDAQGVSRKARVIEEALARHGLEDARAARCSRLRRRAGDRRADRRHHHSGAGAAAGADRRLHRFGRGAGRGAYQSRLRSVAYLFAPLARARAPSGARSAVGRADPRS